MTTTFWQLVANGFIHGKFQTFREARRTGDFLARKNGWSEIRIVTIRRQA